MEAASQSSDVLTLEWDNLKTESRGKEGKESGNEANRLKKKI